MTTLDVESPEGTAAASAIGHVLKSLIMPVLKTQVDTEYIERCGIIHVSRILPDGPINQVKVEESRGRDVEVKSIRDMKTCARLKAERLGTLDSLHFVEISMEELPVKDNCVEVEIYAAGLNFKDVAVTMGIVPENESLLGLGDAGIVRQVGKGAGSYKPGDRVVVFEKGTFANRIQVTTQRTHLLPDTTSFEDGATITSVYLTSVYCLFNLGNLQRGHSILIHSAAGGIGIACIQLARYKGAEIYVIVGTEEKRNFLHETFCILFERMFPSRTTKFASQIMKTTHGRGIDVILNSLTGGSPR